MKLLNCVTKLSTMKKLNYEIIDLEQGSTEWRAFRHDKIGASDAAIIMCESPWMTEFELWKDKTDKKESQVATPAMQRGIDLEQLARDKYNEMTGRDMKPTVLVSVEWNWMMASLDGLSSCKTSAVEIKCPGKIDHLTACEGKIPKKYYAQLQHILAVSKLDMVDYFSFDGENGVIITCPRNDEYIEEMIVREENFMKCYRSLTPPALVKRDYNKIKAEAEIQNAIISISNIWKAA